MESYLFYIIIAAVVIGFLRKMTNSSNDYKADQYKLRKDVRNDPAKKQWAENKRRHAKKQANYDSIVYFVIIAGILYFFLK